MSIYGSRKDFPCISRMSATYAATARNAEHYLYAAARGQRMFVDTQTGPDTHIEILTRDPNIIICKVAELCQPMTNEIQRLD